MTSHNPAFARALRSLTHPLTLAAVLLLLLNDHILRWNWPSWWTGKLGDAAWLAFFPLMLAAVFAWIVPRRWKKQERIVAGLAFGVTGLLFASMKTIPAAHAAGLRVLEWITGGPFTLRMDVTDLLALPAMGVAWVVWRRTEPVTTTSRRAPAWAIVVLAAGIFSSIATSMAPTKGVHCLAEGDNTLLAATWVDLTGATVDDRSFGKLFESQNGGLTWHASSPAMMNRAAQLQWNCPPIYPENYAPISDPRDAHIMYRFHPGDVIQRSQDGGATWEEEISVEVYEAQGAYYRDLYGAFSPGPFSGLVDRESGNIVFAMGVEGVLLRVATREWRWISVSDYEHVSLNRWEDISSLLQSELWLGVMLPFLISVTFGAQVKKEVGRFLLATLFWLIWVFVVWSSPANSVPVSSMILHAYGFVPLILICVLIWRGIIGFLEVHHKLQRIPSEVWSVCLIASLLFELPYLLWSQGTLPRYQFAMVSALVLALVTVAAGWYSLSRTLKQSPGTGEGTPPEPDAAPASA